MRREKKLSRRVSVWTEKQSPVAFFFPAIALLFLIQRSFFPWGTEKLKCSNYDNTSFLLCVAKRLSSCLLSFVNIAERDVALLNTWLTLQAFNCKQTYCRPPRMIWYRNDCKKLNKAALSSTHLLSNVSSARCFFSVSSSLCLSAFSTPVLCSVCLQHHPVICLCSASFNTLPW